MKIIIAGSRTIMDFSLKNLMYTFFHSETPPFKPTKITEVVSGGAKGIDKLGEEWAAEEYFYDSGHTKKEKIPVKRFEADWETHGKAAGPIRNKQMAAYSDFLLLIWDGNSKGSANMKKEMQALNKPFVEVIYDDYR